jgi:MFS family permease
LIDIITYGLSIAILVAIRIPSPPRTAEGRAGSGSLLSETLYGWTYIATRPGLLGLLLFFAVSNFLMSTIVVLANPLILSFTTPNVLGFVLSVAGSGILVGSVLMSIWGGPKQRVYGVLGGILLSSVCMIVAGLAPSALLIGGAAFFFTLGMPIIAGSSQAIWQSKVLPEVQGRVFATRTTIAAASMPVAYLVSGPLADYVFNPLLSRDGALAGSVGQIIGAGPGRGIGLLFIVLGFLGIVSVIGGYLYPRLRLVEQELPDAVADAPLASAVAIEPDLAGA